MFLEVIKPKVIEFINAQKEINKTLVYINMQI